MPLHLLGKKSWNVYGAANIERVRRDEAEAQAREAAEEQLMQENDARRRIAILRGETSESVPSALPESPEQDEGRDAHKDVIPRKRRRLRGEDETDADIRFAREDGGIGQRAAVALLKHGSGDAPLQDDAGHIQLIPAPDRQATRQAEKNAEAEADKAKRRKCDEDQYTMRFENATGLQQGTKKPWYADSACATSTAESNERPAHTHMPNKDVWGNEDPLRKDRERARVISNDPFAVMQQAQRQLKQNERDRDRWKNERVAEMAAMNESDVRQKRRRRSGERGDGDDIGSLDGFRLDSSARSSRPRKHHDNPRHKRSHRRRRSRSSQ